MGIELVDRSGPSAAEAPPRRCVLVADDHRASALYAESALQACRCDVVLAAHGAEALAHWKKARFACIFLDVYMPEMDGLTATFWIRTLESRLLRPRTPIIAISANTAPLDRERCRRIGFDDFLSKPVRVADFAGKLAQWAPAHDPVPHDR